MREGACEECRPKRQRCAIYTRKSVEPNLDLAFDSLDAQRETCEAYVNSQAHERTDLVASFDDGADRRGPRFRTANACRDHRRRRDGSLD